TSVDIAARDFPITCRAKATLAKTVLFGSRRKSWNTVPIPRRRYGTFQLGIFTTDFPAMWIRPAVGTSSRRMRRMTVDLPEPEAPTRNTNSPRSASNEISSRALRERASWDFEADSNLIKSVFNHVAGGSAGSAVRNGSVMFAEAYGRVGRSDEVHSHASGAGWRLRGWRLRAGRRAAAEGWSAQKVACRAGRAAADRAIRISRERNVGYRRKNLRYSP